MSSPLIFRIVTNADLSGISQTQDAFKGLSMSANQITSSAKGSSQVFQQLTSNIKDIPPIPKEASNSLKSFVSGIRLIKSEIRLLRTGLFVGAFLFAPIIAAVKAAADLQSKLNPLVTTLNQLGLSGKIQGDRFLEFAKALEKSGELPTTKTLEALNSLISKTRSVADAENLVLTARKISLATGQDFMAVVAALSEAMSGNASSLAKMTLKTEDYITSAVKAGTVSSTLGKAFEKDAARGAQTLGNRFSRLTTQVKAGIGELLLKSTPGGSIFAFILKQAKEANNEIGKTRDRITALNTILKQLRTPEKNIPVTLRNFEEIQFALTAARGEAEKLDNAIKTGDGLSSSVRSKLEDQLVLRKQIVTTLEDLLSKERELSTAERQRIRDQTAELELKRQEQKIRRLTGGDDFLLDPDVERRRKRQSRREEEIAISSVRRQRDEILSTRKLTADDEILLEKELAVKLGDLRLKEQERVREREKKISSMSPAELQKMKDEEARAKKDLMRSSRSRISDAEVDFLRESSRIRSRGGAATGVTAEQKEASDRIEALRKKIADTKFSLNLDPSFTPGTFEKLAKVAAQTFATSYMEYLEKGLSNENKNNNLSTAPVAGSET